MSRGGRGRTTQGQRTWSRPYKGPPQAWPVQERIHAARTPTELREKREARSSPPSVKEWEDAINRSSMGQTVPEQQAGIFPLEDGESASIQSTEAADAYTLRVGIGDEDTLRSLVSVYSWTVELTIQEGYRGSKFVDPISTAISQPFFVPVKGIALELHGDAIFATALNLSGGARTLSFALMKRAIRESTKNIRGDNILSEIPEFAVDFSVDVEGGAQAGDTVSLFDYAGGLLVTFPASDVGRWGVWTDAAYVLYTPAGGAVLVTYKYRILR